MSISSITIRLDFGEESSSGVSGGISLQGEGVTQTDLPTPFANIVTTATQDSAPRPMSGIEGMSAAMNTPPVPSLDIEGMSAAMNTPPVPSLDIEGMSASGITDDIPRPEGEPKAVKKPTGKKS